MEAICHSDHNQLSGVGPFVTTQQTYLENTPVSPLLQVCQHFLPRQRLEILSFLDQVVQHGRDRQIRRSLDFLLLAFLAVGTDLLAIDFGALTEAIHFTNQIGGGDLTAFLSSEIQSNPESFSTESKTKRDQCLVA